MINNKVWYVIDRGTKRKLGRATSMSDAIAGMKEARKAGYNADVQLGVGNPGTAQSHCYAVIDMGSPLSGTKIRYTVQSLPDSRPLQVPTGVEILVRGMTRQAARALADHLNDQVKRGRHMPRKAVVKVKKNASLRKKGRGVSFMVRRSNPTLAVLNPPTTAAGDDIEATWAQIEYRRPDDPEGKRVVRVHEFTDGFIATPLEDGSILLRHPQGRNLWTRR